MSGKIDLAQLIDVDELRQQVIEDAAGRIANDVMRSSKNEIVDKARKLVEAEISERITEIADSALNKSFQPVNTWGEPTGEPTTVRDELAKKMETWWNERVDNSGNKTDYHGTPRAQYLCEKLMKDLVDSELRQEMRVLVNDGKQRIKAKMAETVASVISREW